MAINNGVQIIGWKYYTPLKGDYLNTITAGMVTPGLVTRPNITVIGSGSSSDSPSISVQIRQFTAFIHPSDEGNEYTDSSGNTWNSRLAKITTCDVTNPILLNSSHVAIGLEFQLGAKEASNKWDTNAYGTFRQLQQHELAEFKGIIIATVQAQYSKTVQSVPYYFWSITTSGADISNVLLEQEGWDPKCWLSLISPRRLDPNTPVYDKFEVRTFNDPYRSTMSGYNRIIQYNGNVFVYSDSNGRKISANPSDLGTATNYNYISLNTSGIAVDKHNTWATSATKRSFFAYINITSNPDPGFINKDIIKPIVNEDWNISIESNSPDNSTYTLFIR